MHPIRTLLQPSGLLGEVSDLDSQVRNSYYGFNVTKSDREPIDQIHGFLAAKRLQESLGGTFWAFIAGLFEVVNCRTMEERDQLIRRNSSLEEGKRLLFEELAGRLHVDARIVTTDDLWRTPEYWDIFETLLRDRDRFSRKTLMRDTLAWYQDADSIDRTLPFRDALFEFPVPESVLRLCDGWPAALLYTPLEVAEALFFAKQCDVNVKIGHMEERTYDRYIAPHMSIVHLRQPSDLKSTRLRPRTVTPYIDKPRRDPKVRMYFDDDVAGIEERLTVVSDESYVHTISGAGEILHPYVDKGVFAVEAARASGHSIELSGVQLRSGSDLIEAVCGGRIKLTTVREALPELITTYVTSSGS